MSDPARRRFVAITLARAAGVAIAIAGLVLTQRAATDGGRIAAFAVLIGGIGLTFYLPIALARRWRSPGP